MISKRRNKFHLALSVLIALLLILPALSSFACEEQSGGDDGNDWDEGENTGYFADVPEDHWAFEAVEWMVANNILTGYGDNSFRPDNAVTRAEFAKMMVNVMKISKSTPSKPSFDDVSKSHWAYQYVETAKYYLTGYRTSSGDCFKPGFDAVREDMAVALVKVLGYGNEEEDGSVFTAFTDTGKISPNLKRFVSLAIKHELIQGYPGEGSGLFEFKPLGKLTRAEAAVLLYRTMKQEEEKVTYDEDKVTYDGETQNGYPVPAVTVSLIDGRLVVNWEEITDSRLEGYKVVISKSNPHPKYSEDGYLYWITDLNRTQAVVDNSEPYKSGDFGQYLDQDTQYYFSVTAVYNGWVKIPGNAVRYRYTE